MNRQEIFDKAVTHLFTQRRQAYTAAGCAYRSKRGAKCVIGCLIPDALYNTDMEGKTVDAVCCSDEAPRTKKIKTFLNYKRHRVFYTGLQDIHDKAEYWFQYPKNMDWRVLLSYSGSADSPLYHAISDGKEFRTLLWGVLYGFAKDNKLKCNVLHKYKDTSFLQSRES